MSDIEQRARELLAACYEAAGRRGAAQGVRNGAPIHESPVRVIIAALTPPKIDTGNWGSDPLYAAMDALYDRGWADLHKQRKNDPRGTLEWGAVLELVRAALSQQQAVPEGFVLVPVEPTEEMLSNLYGRNLLDADDSELRGAYRELLAAGPELQP